MKLLATAGLVLLAGLFAPVSGLSAGGVAEPTGYRLDDYRSAVPDTLTGARVVSVGEAETLWRAKDVVFIDVMPRMARPAGLPAETVWREAPRMHIPGSIWLPNTGYGLLTDEAKQYFREGLETSTGGDKAKVILFYCLTDCWMSWNAAKRAIEWGYRSVIWFPAGSDGWQAQGLPVIDAKPFVAGQTLQHRELKSGSSSRRKFA